MRTVFVLTLLASSLQGANMTLIRRVSQAAGCAASMWDAQTTSKALSLGAHETNSILGGSSNSMGRIYGIKIGVCAGGFIFSEIAHHYNRGYFVDKNFEAGWTIGGAAQSALFTGLAFHNLGVIQEQKKINAASLK